MAKSITSGLRAANQKWFNQRYNTSFVNADETDK